MVKMLACGQIYRWKWWSLKASFIDILINIIRLIRRVIYYILEVIGWLFYDAQVTSALRWHHFILSKIECLSVRRLGTLSYTRCMAAETLLLLVVA